MLNLNHISSFAMVFIWWTNREHIPENCYIHHVSLTRFFAAIFCESIKINYYCLYCNWFWTWISKCYFEKCKIQNLDGPSFWSQQEVKGLWREMSCHAGPPSNWLQFVHFLSGINSGMYNFDRSVLENLSITILPLTLNFKFSGSCLAKFM